MPDVEAVSSSPTCGVPLIAGVPVAAVFLSDSAAVTVFVAVRSSGWTSYTSSLFGLSGCRGYGITSTVTTLSGSGPPRSSTVSSTSGIVAFPSPK